MEHDSNDSLPPITTKSYAVGNELSRLAIELQGRAGRIQFDRQLAPTVVDQRSPDAPEDFWNSIQSASDDFGRKDLECAKHLFEQLTREISQAGTKPTENTSTSMQFDQPFNLESVKDTIELTPGAERTVVDFQANTDESVREAARRSLVELVIRSGVERQQKIVSLATKAAISDLMQSANLE